MNSLVIGLFIWAFITGFNRYFERKAFQKLEKEVQDLRYILRRRMAGQSWERIVKDDEETELIRRYMGID
jgi:hypothetical protein